MMQWSDPGETESQDRDWSERVNDLLYGAVRNITIAWGVTALMVIAVRMLT